jgi:glutamate dehydrogenase/leucine dehydrogenase
MVGQPGRALMDSRQIVPFEGYRVPDKTARGPAKSGIRYNPNVTQGEAKALRARPSYV